MEFVLVIFKAEFTGTLRHVSNAAAALMLIDAIGLFVATEKKKMLFFPDFSVSEVRDLCAVLVASVHF